jgi:ribonuclease G
MSTLKASFEGDKSKIVIYPFTQLNLVQIARERRGKPIGEYMEEECDCCKGMGKKLRLWYLQGLIKNEILRISKDYECKNIYIEMHNMHKTEIEKNISEFIENIAGTNKIIYAKFVEEVDCFKIEPLIFPNHIENVKKYKIYG